ncbi:hypothetical protein K0M31_010222 [Melipona bicolor]|uniref:Uncharacterized protein n=1 Tax=Melipona bicolor TaxID=60889 RepID=A0AA40KIH7_9HYME|nr:hypothetical protein K0M31_010222 [Melipona bicolor]
MLTYSRGGPHENNLVAGFREEDVFSDGLFAVLSSLQPDEDLSLCKGERQLLSGLLPVYNRPTAPREVPNEILRSPG